VVIPAADYQNSLDPERIPWSVAISRTGGTCFARPSVGGGEEIFMNQIIDAIEKESTESDDTPFL